MYSKLCLLTSLALFALIGTSTAQPKQNQRFSGKWLAKVKDSVICTIALRVDDAISGSVADCRIHTDPDGNLIEAEPVDISSKPSPISNARIVGAVLSFD